MNQEDLIADIRLKKNTSIFERVDIGELVVWPFLKPCRVKILMVVDASISYNNAYFGLSAVLDTLRTNPEFFVKFDVTRAHRQTDLFKPDQNADPVAWARYGPHFENFSFTQPGFNIDDYHEVWLFGFYSGGLGALSDAELEVLSRWMDKGGGVLAMGDHATLGEALCSRIPRVRSMRRWTNAQGVPPQNGPNRHDSLVPGNTAAYTFDDESDVFPMPITPKMYGLWGWSPFFQRVMPHPILCGKDGVIDILPDHPHEGDVVEPPNVNGTFSFGAYQNRPEYPNANAGGPRPEVIATAQVQNNHPAAGFKGVATAKTFGVIGAYDGHKANVGRVGVDSTWHHWFDVNLIGRPAGAIDSIPPDNAKLLGFAATPAGMVAYARIQNYFRNMALWLAPKDMQACMFWRATWGVIIRYPLIERLDIRLPLWELGGVALDAIGRRASQCTRIEWVKGIFDREIERLFPREIVPPPPDPCLSCPPFEALETWVLGGATRELLRLAYELEEKGDRGEVDEGAVVEAFQRGLRAGAEEYVRDFDRSLTRSRRQLTALRRVISPNVEQFSV